MGESKVKKVTQSFYDLTSIEAAPLLLGKFICREIEGKVIKSKIIETEAYFGETDTACHASKGKTKRTKILYEKGGIAYVYLCYGIHSLLNVVTGQENFPQAVLIRGIENYAGPGKLTKYLKIDTSFNGENLLTSNRLWIEDEGSSCEYTATPRIGIDYATEEYRNKLWRFLAK